MCLMCVFSVYLGKDFGSDRADEYFDEHRDVAAHDFLVLGLNFVDELVFDGKQ